MARAANIYTLSLTANQTKEILADAGMYKVLSLTGTIRINRTNGNALTPMLAGQGEREDFQRISVTDLSGAANTVVILVADKDFIDDRVYGEVSVIDGEKARTLAGGMYMGTCASAAVVAQLAHCQLWNPIPTKNLIVTQLSVMSTSLSQIGIGFYNVALATDNTATSIQNKKQGAPAASAQSRAAASAASLISVVGQTLYVLANVTQPWPIKGAIVVPPSQGLTLYSGTVNQSMVANFEWFEEAV